MTLAEMMENKTPHVDSWEEDGNRYVDVVDSATDIFLEADEDGKILLFCAGMRGV